MKKALLLIILLTAFLNGRSQTLLMNENFEVVDSAFSYGNPGWNQNSRLSVSPTHSDSTSASASDTSYLEMIATNPLFYQYFTFSFNQICKLDTNDQAYVEVSTDLGVTWTRLTPSNSIYLGTSDFATRQKFDQASYPDWVPGNNSAVPQNTWWKNEEFDVSQLIAFTTDVRFRFVLVDGNNDGSNGCSGWTIDDVMLLGYLFTPADLELKTILNPPLAAVAGSVAPVEVKITNTGSAAYSNFQVSYSVNGGPATTITWPDTLLPQDSATVSLPSFIVPSAAYVLCSFVDPIQGSDLTDDTICGMFMGSPLVNLPYTDDFEGANPGWFDPDSLISPTKWETGMPNYGLTNTTHSGTRCWDTNLDTTCFGNANSILYSPLFNFSTVGNADLSFWQNRNTEPLVDGLRLEYSINGGGWNLLGLAYNPLTSNWYTDSAINATAQPGWEGNSGGWILSSYPLPSVLAGQPVVQFRFVFSSDNSVNSDGVSIDDFSISLSPCGNSIYYSSNPGTCGDSVSFNFNASAGVASQFWDLGNNSNSSQVSATGFYTSGSYTITLFTLDSNGCAASSILNYTAASGFEADAGPDVFTCGAATQLGVILTVPGTSYTYSWSPIAGLDNPFISGPQASHVDSLTYTVTVTDTVTGCSASDQVMVSSYSGYNTVITICTGGATFLDLGPGALSYQWQTFTDTLGNIFPISSSNQSILATQPGTYLATATFPLCGVLNSQFIVQIDTSCITDVWPGDCNYDQVVNNHDFLNIGLAYGSSGPLRPGASLNWVAQPCPDWNYYFPAGINFKHSDCNGSGMVDSSDVQGIFQNYSLVHPLKPGEATTSLQSTPPLFLTASADTLGLSDTLRISVNLGTLAIPVDSIYGIAYTILYESNLVDTNFASNDYNTSWMGFAGQNLTGMEKHFLSQGKSDLALTRTDHINVLNGNGTLAVMTIVTTDNLSGKTMMHLNLQDAEALTHSGYVIPLATLGDSVVMDPNFTGIKTVENDYELVVFPNPVKSEIIIRSRNIKIFRIEVKNALGQQIKKVDATGMITRIDVADQSSGILFLSVLSDKGVISKKVQVLK